MAKFKITIDSVLGGIMPSEFAGQKDQYFSGFGIDPDAPFETTGARPRIGASIMPVSYAKFSSTNVTGWPIWFLTSPKDTNVYAYLSDGKLISYSGALGSETAIGTPTSGAGNGAAYYNNYHYLATPTDISRYGRLDGSPSIANTFWTGTLGLTALTNTAYPNFANFPYPNHPMHVHSDNKLYIGDFVVGQGQIHFIKTKKTTTEGDTNDGSTYGALKLPFGMRPIDIESYGTDLAILCFRGDYTGANSPRQGSAALYLWDTTTSTFYREIFIPAPFASSLINKNGELFLFVGNDLAIGYQILRFLGGYAFEQVFYCASRYPPPAGAIDVNGNRLLWGDKLDSDPSISSSSIRASVLAMGSVDARLGSRQINSIASLSPDVAQNPSVSALKMVQLNISGIGSAPVVGWGQATNTTYGIDKLDTGNSNGVFIGRPVITGRKFKIDKIRLNLSKAVDSTCSIAVSLMCNGDRTVTAVRTINNTKDSGKRRVVLAPGIVGEHSFAPVFTFSNTGRGPAILLPITVEGELYDD